MSEFSLWRLLIPSSPLHTATKPTLTLNRPRGRGAALWLLAAVLTVGVWQGWVFASLKGIFARTTAKTW